MICCVGNIIVVSSRHPRTKFSTQRRFICSEGQRAEIRDKNRRYKKREREKVTKKRGERGQGIEVSSIYAGGYGAGLPLAREERDRCAP